MYEPDIVTKEFAVEIKSGVSAIRDVRDNLVQLGKFLAKEPGMTGYLLLINTRISQQRVQQELRQLETIVHSEIMNRVHVLPIDSENLSRSMNDIPQPLLDLLKSEQWFSNIQLRSLPRPDKQAEVTKVLVLHWITGREPFTADQIVKEVGASYRTVVAAVGKLGPAVEQSSDKKYRLKYFPQEAWNRLTASARQMRATEYYLDISGQPRSLEFLMTRILNWERRDIAIGGTVGAQQHFNELDIMGLPRLDLCVHVPKNQVDPISFDRIDPGLESTNDPHGPVRLAVHYLRRRTSFFETTRNGLTVADPVECLVDLQDAGLGLQANQFLGYLRSRGESGHEASR